ncbi:MAG: Membrane-associated zinc metalloprotease [uncultured Thermomicrobiales bacterium]|uniref:Membrane-associated zinc metalloprotease n=1 Tax=uncultured Thermomicrobiales bacterium TaxID=1645740 RepID=A0A6J4UPR4_9BACT|nr:MAG: Membrane-associated zinc metalloprotease [uncultured Thermomicrobiales bacterium]
MSGLYIIPILAVLILIHEIGHYASARLCGVKVEEFGIGIPPRVKGWTRNGVIWSINAIPFGGFVRVKGEDGADMDPGSMNTKSPAQRAFFLAAGSAMNVLLAIVLMFVLVGALGVSNTNTYVNDVRPGSPAEAAGWRPGDRIVATDGDEVESVDDLVARTGDSAGRRVTFTLERDGQRFDSTVVPREDPPAGEGATGIVLSEATEAHVDVDRVESGSVAAVAGLAAGDRITAVAGQPVDDEFAVAEGLRRAQGSTVALTVERDDATRDVTLPVPIQGLELTEIGFDTPAFKAGWVPAESGTIRLLTIDGQPILDATDLATAARAHAGTTVSAIIQRGDARIGTDLAVPQLPAGATDTDVAEAIGIVEGRMPSVYDAVGIAPDVVPIYDRVSPSRIIPVGFQQAWEQTRAMIDGLVTLLTGGADLNQLAGPIGMGQITSEALAASPLPTWAVLTQLSILLSLNLAVLNLLPLPALDGGRLFFVLIELLRGGRRIAPEKEGVVHFVGLVVLLGVMFVIAFADVRRILDGGSFFQ